MKTTTIPRLLDPVEATEAEERRLIGLMNGHQLQKVLDDLGACPQIWNDPAAIRRAVQRRIKALGLTQDDFY